LRWGWPAAVVTLICDQAVKLGVMRFFGLSATEIMALAPEVDAFPQGLSYPLLPVLDLTVTWNRGISYGLFQQDTETGRRVLVCASLVAVLVLAAWMHRAVRPFVSLSFGLIIGGALGNVIDRAAYGAVFDFAHFHLGDFSWYIFNIADAAIVLGAAGLAFDALKPAKKE
jgi:signal peptidase II